MRIWTVTFRIQRDTCTQQVFHPTENFRDTLESVRLGKPLYSSGSRTWYEYRAFVHGATHVAIKRFRAKHTIDQIPWYMLVCSSMSKISYMYAILKFLYFLYIMDFLYMMDFMNSIYKNALVIYSWRTRY